MVRCGHVLQVSVFNGLARRQLRRLDGLRSASLCSYDEHIHTRTADSATPVATRGPGDSAGFETGVQSRISFNAGGRTHGLSRRDSGTRAERGGDIVIPFIESCWRELRGLATRHTGTLCGERGRVLRFPSAIPRWQFWRRSLRNAQLSEIHPLLARVAALSSSRSSTPPRVICIASSSNRNNPFRTRNSTHS